MSAQQQVASYIHGHHRNPHVPSFLIHNSAGAKDGMSSCYMIKVHTPLHTSNTPRPWLYHAQQHCSSAEAHDITWLLPQQSDGQRVCRSALLGGRSACNALEAGAVQARVLSSAQCNCAGWNITLIIHSRCCCNGRPQISRPRPKSHTPG